jgi:hypothetical protein
LYWMCLILFPSNGNYAINHLRDFLCLSIKETMEVDIHGFTIPKDGSTKIPNAVVRVENSPGASSLSARAQSQREIIHYNIPTTKTLWRTIS